LAPASFAVTSRALGEAPFGFCCAGICGVARFGEKEAQSCIAKKGEEAWHQGKARTAPKKEAVAKAPQEDVDKKKASSEAS
jgi:hypothetical protein